VKGAGKPVDSVADTPEGRSGLVRALTSKSSREPRAGFARRTASDKAADRELAAFRRGEITTSRLYTVAPKVPWPRADAVTADQVEQLRQLEVRVLSMRLPRGLLGDRANQCRARLDQADGRVVIELWRG
jgi:hypothetical protein